MNTAWLSTSNGVDEFLSTPSEQTIKFLEKLPDGDFSILGIGGKIGPTLATMLVDAVEKSGVRRKVFGVSRFSDAGLRSQLESKGVCTIACDLSDMKAVEKLPKTKYVIFMAGRKFGDVGSEPMTWMMNVAMPYNVVSHYRYSHFVAYSTGCVYPLVSAQTNGCTEEDAPQPVGEYANSCIGRERIFEYAAQKLGCKVVLYRLNYAIDVRYGVINDIAQKIVSGQSVDLSVSHYNCIWQGEANDRTIRCFGLVAAPAAKINITGIEKISVRETAQKLGRLLGKEVIFSGKSGGGMYLSDATEASKVFGTPQITSDQMIEWTAQWLINGGKSLNKPTHFTVTDGQFLD